MPILPSEPQLFPDRLFEDRDKLTHRTWWVLHTLPRQEKSLARQLHARNVPYYLPLIANRLRVRNRPVTSHLPLFTGYLFLLADPEERLAALATHRVARAIQVNDQGQLWRDLDQIHRLVLSGAAITPEDRLAPGSLVEIRSGPLAGLRGKILDRASRRRFVVEVDFIQRGASIYLDDFALAPLTD
jgi:transcription antitermination factor NusG